MKLVGDGGVMSQEEFETAVAKKRYLFVNVWRNIDRDSVIRRKPLAMMDPRSTTEDKWLIYELCYPDRTGENYSLPASEAQRNQWFYYPDMSVDECLLFSVYDRGANDHRFVFHTAFDLPEDVQDPALLVA